MNLTTALRALAAATDHVPDEAVHWFLGHWDLASTAALQVLARVARDPESAPDADLASAYFLLHVCAEKRETKAFPLIVSLSKDPAGIDDILGDAQLLIQAPILVSVFDGNLEGLFAILDAPHASVMTKAATFAALAWLTAAGKADRARVEAFFMEFPDVSTDNPLAGWDGWAMAVALLAHEAGMGKVREAYQNEALAELMPDLREVEDVFRIARDEKDPLTVFEREGLAPIDDAIARLATTEVELQEIYREAMEGDDDEEDDSSAGADGETTGAPVVNPFRDVGRNDPCPCGSGKKFKKCCGAAA